MTNKPKLKNCVFEPVILPCYFKLGRFTYTIIGLNLNERMQFCIFFTKKARLNGTYFDTLHVRSVNVCCYTDKNAFCLAGFCLALTFLSY